MKEAEGGAALDSDGLERTIEDALKVTDADHLQDVGRLAHERDPEKYPYTHLTSLTTSNYVAGNPLYDILHDGRTTFDGPPLLSLKAASTQVARGTAVKEWKVDMPALVTHGATWGGDFLGVERFTGALPNLQDGQLMFYLSSLTSWDVELPSLTSGDYMFYGCEFTEWHADLPSLENGRTMFDGCRGLRTFDGDLPNLQNGHMMFMDTAFQSFSLPMPSLGNGGLMFWGTPLQSFSSEVPRLSDGSAMFHYCSGLTQFSSPLPSLTNGARMLDSCKLNLDSVQTVARTIKDNSDMATPPTLGIGIAKGLKGQVDVELDLIRAKGWAVNVYYH